MDGRPKRDDQGEVRLPISQAIGNLHSSHANPV